ncbi:hypothetical protein [Chondromyces apiculatus]|uniref:Uncharacterized protein n=1 Tax=Chondromyces apiculatus DSM 436 TaxID=1192034 RepID=A0A017T5B9_9BACT|nr:hypothetical protein [Chondromyces apiculatus]EYF04463.1 Hypothetical protein CAP_4431 [Chondromyces apiculatus DSM 436]
MSLFETLLQTLLGPDCTATLTRSEEGHPALELSTGGTVVLEPEYLVVDEDADYERFPQLCALGAGLRHLHDFLDRFPAMVQRGDERAELSLDVPISKPLWSDEGLWANVRLFTWSGDTLVNVMEQENLLVTREALYAHDWQARLDAFDARRAAWADAFDTLQPEAAQLEIPPEPQLPIDDGWDAFAEALGLAPDALQARVAVHAEAAAAQLPRVRAHYEQLYSLKLPSGIAYLAALVSALGDLPQDPPDPLWESPPGLSRGSDWLDAGLSVRLAGISGWFAPDALSRETHDASVMHDEVPPGGEGPLDARLDMRYRRNAPQFVAFLGGDSDGLHWGFWYDSPDHFPVIAHNYARDSAETWLDADPEIPAFLRGKIAKATQQILEELATLENDENRHFALKIWRCLRVIEAHLDALDALDTLDALSPPHPGAALRAPADEPRCPWPRTDRYPVGSPPLALRPDAGTVPSSVPGFSLAHDGDPSPAHLKASLEEAQRDLAEGRPAHAHALGLYLHWRDADDLRDDAGALLLATYEALGFHPFAAILKVHLLHRDLGSVGVFKND